jgi:sulfur-carrier protein
MSITLMKITLLYFARLREVIGIEREVLEIPAHVHNVGSLRYWLRGRSDAYDKALAPDAQVRVAVDQQMGGAETPIRDGAEIAFFPPVTGGST